MAEIIHKELSYRAHGILLHVRNELGPMLPEAFYRDAANLALAAAGIRCEVEKPFTVLYRGTQVGVYYVDLWLEDGKILLELKSSIRILPLHKAQAISYLKVTNADLAIVVNFGSESFTTERLPNFLANKQPSFTWQPTSLAVNILYPELTNQVFKILHQIHFELGSGFLHQVYCRATMIALQQDGLLDTYIQELPVYYQGHHLGNRETHLICIENKILLAAVAVAEITESMQSRLKAILIQQGLQLGFIANFNGVSLVIKPVRSAEKNEEI
jgi:GxxExxY protein